MLQTDQYSLNIGPIHPSTHGGLHVETVLDGEMVVDATVHMGYVHRAVEKIAESRTYMQFIPYASRLDYLASQLPTLGYVQTVEKMMNIEVPERAEYIRVIMAEFSRIASHILFVASLAQDLAATTAFCYCMRDREQILDLFQMTSGQRMVTSYMRIGGFAEDIPEEFIPGAKKFLKELPAMIEEYEGLLTGNEIFQARLKNVGILSGSDAINNGVTGPTLRASGVNYDIRKAEPYGIYDRFDFEVPLGEKGDNWDRYLVHLREIEQSARIIEQALDQLPEGEIRSKVPRILKPEKGLEVYHRIESSKGELGYYLVSDGGEKPYRLHVRAPSFVNLMSLPLISRGGKLADVIANIAALDPVLGEADR